MINQIAIEIISIGGMAMGGLAFGVCMGFGMWASGVRMTVATVERREDLKKARGND